MTSTREVRIPVERVTHRAKARIAVVGTPNSGKSTLFNRLTGLRQRIGNYPGVTVERHVGVLRDSHGEIELIDLPGAQGLSTQSMEERVTVDAVLGRLEGGDVPTAMVVVVDATNLYQGLFLLQQLMELRMPIAVALTMSDAARAAGIAIDTTALSGHLGGLPVVPVVATTGSGIERLVETIAALPEAPPAEPVTSAWPEMVAELDALAATCHQPRALLLRTLVSPDSELAADVRAGLTDSGRAALDGAADRLFGDVPPLVVEARKRYSWARETLGTVSRRGAPVRRWTDRLARFFNRPWPGTLGLFVVMLIVFQAVFAWATPFMDLIDAGTAALGSLAIDVLGDGMLGSLVADGIIAGVGSVIIFLPQILILFLFIVLLEDSGYLARAAYLMDRLMRSVGLSGQSIIPMISSFACAVPGIMATRVIPNRRDRIATILAAPFMTCSARLPVYALLIAAFVPERAVGPFNLQGLVLFGLYVGGIVMGVVTALLIRKTAFRGPRPAFALMLPEFRRPNLRTVALQLLARARTFLLRAGTVIFTVAVVVWALAYFPRLDDADARVDAMVAALPADVGGQDRAAAVADIENRVAALQLEQSALGHIGRFIAPAFEPLGWDWRVSAAVIAGFPAREVVIAVLGTVYAIGDEAQDATLAERLRQSTWPDGTPVFTLPMVIGMLIFYALCLQCAATIAVMHRETNSWRWPIFSWLYMTSLGYAGALLAYQLGS